MRNFGNLLGSLILLIVSAFSITPNHKLPFHIEKTPMSDFASKNSDNCGTHDCSKENG